MEEFLSISYEDFKALIRGKVVKKRFGFFSNLNICLSDIGFALMYEAIAEAIDEIKRSEKRPWSNTNEKDEKRDI